MREFTDQELIRREKAEKIREMGIDPFGSKFDRTAFNNDIKEKYKDKIACLHYKDLKVVKHKVQTYAEVGQGNLDWDEIIEASKNSSTEFALVEQDECDKDPFESLKISYDFLVTKGFC